MVWPHLCCFTSQSDMHVCDIQTWWPRNRPAISIITWLYYTTDANSHSNCVNGLIASWLCIIQFFHFGFWYSPVFQGVQKRVFDGSISTKTEECVGMRRLGDLKPTKNNNNFFVSILFYYRAVRNIESCSSSTIKICRSLFGSFSNISFVNKRQWSPVVHTTMEISYRMRKYVDWPARWVL